ncbi:MAG: hypothetical protein K2X93_04360 [Candidatus Obscuribacterales bacterium]|nr:hypothetical protein [Candidatus Obscuribacterales bacterium]
MTRTNPIYRRFRRNSQGSAITETGPALFLLLIIILFPLLDLMYMGLAFGIVWYLNHLEVRELALRVPSESTQVLTDIDRLFVNQGLGRFVGMTTGSITHPGGARRAGAPVMVTCQTNVTVLPFMSIPFLIPVSGINQPVNFVVTSTRLQEEEGVN